MHTISMFLSSTLVLFFISNSNTSSKTALLKALITLELLGNDYVYYYRYC